MKLTNLKIASAFSIFSLVLVSSIGLLSQSVYAHKKCHKQSLAFPASWVCKPHINLLSRSSKRSCLKVITPPTKYRLVNRSHYVVYYSLNGSFYKLTPNNRRTHEISGTSNSCNKVSNRAVASFDYDTVKSGVQKTTYNLSRGGLSKGYEYYFHSKKDSPILRLLPLKLRTSDRKIKPLRKVKEIE